MVYVGKGCKQTLFSAHYVNSGFTSSAVFFRCFVVVVCLPRPMEGMG